MADHSIEDCAALWDDGTGDCSACPQHGVGRPAPVHRASRGADVVVGCPHRLHEPIGASTGTPCAACAGSPGWPRVASAMRVTPLPPLRRASLADAAVAPPMAVRHTAYEPPPRPPVSTAASDLLPTSGVGGLLHAMALRSLAQSVTMLPGDFNLVVDEPDGSNNIRVTMTSIAQIRHRMR
jgi:hypothetical protein